MTEQQQNATDERRAADLAGVRVEIDAVDDRIHALLIRRAELVEHVAATKRLPDGTLPKGAYRPAREASILRRLHTQNRKPMPFGMIFTLWRQIIGGFTAMQTPVTVSVMTGGGQTGLTATAREHFGAQAHLTQRDSFDQISDDIRSQAGTLGVIPADFGNTAQPWWTACAAGLPDAPHVVAAVPVYGDRITGYCISTTPLEESGHDETLLALNLGTAMPLSAVTDALGRAHIDGTALAQADNEFLIRLNGFHVAPDGPIHQNLADALDIAPSRIKVVGAYPTPIRSSFESENTK